MFDGFVGAVIGGFEAAGGTVFGKWHPNRD